MATTWAVAGLALLLGCTTPADVPNDSPSPLARLEAEIFLSQRGPDSPDARFDIPLPRARDTVVTLSSIEPKTMPASLSCDGPARLHLAGSPPTGQFVRPGTSRRFTLPPRFSGDRVQLALPTETNSCVLDWGDGHRLPLVRENLSDPGTAALDAQARACAGPAAGSDALVTAFFASRALSQSCPLPTGAYALYPDEIEALRLRLEKLTGAHIGRDALLAGDPDMALDFRNAPRFEQIAISYLHIRADLSGYLVARALAFHAARGTKIRIMYTGRLALSLDRKLFEGLASQFPNVQIQGYAWGPPLPEPLSILVGLFRSNHVKLFTALSREPGASFALVGGRNLHDGFFFPALEERPERPYLHDYDKLNLNPLAYVADYEDFEIGLFDRDVVASIISHFGGFWNRDRRTIEMANPADAPAPPPLAGGDGWARHYISLPWADAAGQEQYFVDLIDAAQDEIVAIAPFIFPTAPIDAALLRAAERGVDVLLVTRIGYGEPVSPVVNPSNTRYAALRAGSFRVVDYVPEGRLMHTKIIVIDDRLGIVTASNLNRRSFRHDTENGLVFLDRAVARQLRAVVEDAAEKGEPMRIRPLQFLIGIIVDAVPIIRSLI